MTAQQPKPKSGIRIALKWILWALLAQFILINISAALYAYRFTHLCTEEQRVIDSKQTFSKNIFAKTWRLFKGQRFYKMPQAETPAFPYSTVILKTGNGISIEAWHAKADLAAKGTVILFHGLMGNKSYLLQQAQEFLDWQYDVLLVDLRNHGNSGGTVTTIGFKEAEEVKLAYEYIRQQNVKNIFLWGGSMGATMIIKAVADYGLQPHGLILEMPFESLYSHIKARAKFTGFPEQPFAFLVTFWIGTENGFNGLGFSSCDYAGKIKCPVLLQYGVKDILVTREETDNIYRAIASPHKKLVIYRDAGHQLLLKRDKQLWEKEVKEFLSAG